jgi:AcrR family transcriptional regulator
MNSVRIKRRSKWDVGVTAAPTKPTGRAAKPATRWGDREQRRVDILDAARTRIAADGYLSLSMRDLASGAGVSPATLYSYFATKEELFATLYAEAIRAHTESFRPIADAGLPLAPLLAAVIDGYLDLYRTYGRHFTLWSSMRHDSDPDVAPVPKELVIELRSVTVEHNRVLMDAIRGAAARDDRRVADDRLVPSLLWSCLNGLADHVTSERGRLDPFPASDLVTFSAQRLALAISDPLD